MSFGFCKLKYLFAGGLVFFLAINFLRPRTVIADDRPGIDFFERKIRPVLVQHCYKCHAAGGKKPKGNLLLDSRPGIRKGGDSGPALVPGKPEASLLLKAVRFTSEDLKMPPKGKLSDAVIADFETWIKMGAPDPRDRSSPPTPVVSWEEVLKNRRTWWSLQPVRKPSVPEVINASWSRHPVDRLLQARREQAGLQPAQRADRRTLIRRLSLVLTGLPPASQEVEAFVRDGSSQAYEKLVDSLLASPHFGERWARHWLDVVRYAETHGNEWNYEVHHAWRYRDYLIRAFNQDVPYDQLVREHLAGDLLPRPRWNREKNFNESIIGTSFYRFGEVNHDDCLEFRQIGFDLVDNQLDTLTKAFQATTVACARCHDHKIDAISMKDYYALLGILRSSRQVSHTIDAPEVNEAARQQLRDLKVQIRKELARTWLAEARDLGRYLTAAQAILEKKSKAATDAALQKDINPKRLGAFQALLKNNKTALEDPISPWLALRSLEGPALAAGWRQLADKLARESRERAEFNAKNFILFGDFRSNHLQGWQTSGQGLRDGVSPSGDFAVALVGDQAVTKVHPAGFFSHALSEKLNGVLRSPVLSQTKKYISFHVLGNKTSAIRLVSNNCQLNYVNYRALTRNELQWKKFAIPREATELRTYAEILTKFDNPKFPDQLGTLGGDTANARVPFEEAARDPHSYFGITHVVVHDSEETPRAELSHLLRLFAGQPPANRQELADRFAEAVTTALQSWSEDRATEDDVRWIDRFLEHGLLTNSAKSTPALAKHIARYRQIDKQLALPRIVPGMADFDKGFDQPLFTRGDFRKPAETVPRRYLEVLGRPMTPRGSGRLQLAEQIASADNPLTARVIVNRLWHHLFGTGIVRTVDDFGRVGELPSHPELLDFLADRLVADGWSMKKMIRFLVLTETFQMSGKESASGKAIDPDNRLLHHYPVRRLEAEAIRDAILATSGRLDRKIFGPSIDPYREQANTDRRLFPGPLDGRGRRSIYIKVNLMEGPRFLSAFDFPGGKVTRGRRDLTNVPAQALALLNDPFVIQQAEFWAQRLLARPDSSPAIRIDHMFQTALGRLPTLVEGDRFTKAASRLAQLHGLREENIMTSPLVWKDLAHALFNVKEFIYIR